MGILYLKIFDNGKIYVGITNNFKRRMKEHDEKEMARFTMADAKSRMEHADIIKDKIETYKKANNMTGSSEYKTFYCYVIENIEELKMKISKFSV